MESARTDNLRIYEELTDPKLKGTVDKRPLSDIFGDSGGFEFDEQPETTIQAEKSETKTDKIVEKPAEQKETVVETKKETVDNAKKEVKEEVVAEKKTEEKKEETPVDAKPELPEKFKGDIKKLAESYQNLEKELTDKNQKLKESKQHEEELRKKLNEIKDWDDFLKEKRKELGSEFDDTDFSDLFSEYEKERKSYENIKDTLFDLRTKNKELEIEVDRTIKERERLAVESDLIKIKSQYPDIDVTDFKDFIQNPENFSIDNIVKLYATTKGIKSNDVKKTETEIQQRVQDVDISSIPSDTKKDKSGNNPYLMDDSDTKDIDEIFGGR